MAPGNMMPPPPRPRLPNSSIEATLGSPGAMELDAAEKKILRDTVFPPDFSKKVDTKKVNLEVLKQWFLARLVQLIGDDDIGPDWGWQILTATTNPNIKHFQIKMTGFLGKHAPKFSKELWALFLSAQENPNGVPPQLLEAKKEELLKQREEKEKREKDARNHQSQERERERDTSRRRRGGRDDRGRGRGDNRRPSFDRLDWGSEDRRDIRDRGARPNYRDIDPQRRNRDSFRGEGRRGSGRYNERRSRSPARVDSYKPSIRRARSSPRSSPRRRSRSRSRSRSRDNRRYRSRSPRRSNQTRRRNSSSPPRSPSRPLTDSRPNSSRGPTPAEFRPNSSSGPTPAESRPGSSGSGMTTSSARLSENGRRKLAEFKKERDAQKARRASDLAEPPKALAEPSVGNEG